MCIELGAMTGWLTVFEEFRQTDVGISSFGGLAKFITHRTTTSGQLKFLLPQLRSNHR